MAGYGDAGNGHAFLLTRRFYRFSSSAYPMRRSIVRAFCAMYMYGGMFVCVMCVMVV